MSDSPPAAGALTIGAIVGNYKVLEKIGEGGMGAVYLAAHPLLGRKAAVKVLLPEHSKKADLVNRFFNEAKTAAGLRHPALVEVFDFGFLPDGSGYIIMDYLEGESLASRLERVAPLPPETAGEIARQIAVGVAAAHGQGIVHRDLKPDNVFLVPDPEQPDRERVKILDFGIAKLVIPSAAGSKGATSTGMLLGTPLFMAPEQCRGAGQVDHRADIYSVGCILYMMLTARPPFDYEGVGEILAAHLHEPVAPPRGIDATIPAELEEIVLRALAKRPEDRQQTMATLATELQAFLYPGAPVAPRASGLIAAARPSSPHPTASRSQAPTPASPSAASRAPSASPSAASPSAATPPPSPAASTFARAPTPLATDSPPARKNRAPLVLAAVVLLGAGTAGAAWYVLRGVASKPARSPVARPAASPTAPAAKPAPPPATESPPPSGGSERPPVVAAVPPPDTAPEAAVATQPDEPERPEQPEQPPAEEPPKRPPPPRRPSAAERAYARGMEHRQRGEEDLAMYAFEEAMRGGLKPDVRAEAERQYLNIRRKYGFLNVMCSERGIEVRIDGRLAGSTPFPRPLAVRPGRHTVVLSGGGYQSRNFSIDVGPTQTAAVKCRF